MSTKLKYGSTLSLIQTSQKQVKKNIKVRTIVRERLRISLILCVLADRDKATHLLIFKGSRNGRKENSHNNNLYVKMPRKCLSFGRTFF